MEYRLVTKAGDIRHIRDSGVPIFDNDGVHVASQGIIQDITEQKHAESIIREREVQIEQVVRLANIGTWIWDFTNDEYEYASPKLAEIYGYDVDELLAAFKKSGSYKFGVHPDDFDILVGKMENSIKNHVIYQNSYRIIRKDGAIRTISDACQHFYDSEGSIVRSIGRTQDITDFIEAENKLIESEATYHWAEEIGKLGHYVWDDINNKCLYCSPELAQMYDITPDEYIEASENEDYNMSLIHPDDQKMYIAVVSVKDRDIDLIFRTIRTDGSIAYFHEYGRRERDENGRSLKINDIIRDVTDEKNAQITLQAALVDAERANQSKSEFLATMSHEFRTPLNAILGFSEMMRAQYFGPLGSESYKEYADDIHNSGAHMLDLVNDVLDIAAIEAGKRPIVKESINLSELLEDSIRKTQPAADDHSIILSLDTPADLPELYADKRSIIQMVFNILSNAIKFTPNNGTVCVSVRATNDEMVISIKDTGIGIPADKISVVVEPFAQTDSNPHTAQKGSGLGLSIVKSLIEAHDGSLKIESELGIGTTVTLTFPFQKTNFVEK